MNQFPDIPGGAQGHDSDEFDLTIKQSVIAEALEAFNAKIIANDLLFSAIRNTLLADDSSGVGVLTDFHVVPNIKDGVYSLCLEESAKAHAGQIESEEGRLGDLFFSFTTMKYIEVCKLEGIDEAGKPTLFIDKPFVDTALGRDVLLEKPTEEERSAVDGAIRTVLQGINEVVTYCSQRGAVLVTDEFGRLQLTDELGQRNYSIEQ